MVDKRQLDEVLFHETDHKPRPDIQYSGSVRIEKKRQDRSHESNA